jgi:hypothetical protein
VRLARVDWVGLLLFLPSAAAVLVPLSLSGVVIPWVSATFLLPTLLGISGLVLLGYHQTCLTDHPMFRRTIYPNSTAIAGHIGSFFHGLLICILVYYLALYYQGVRGLDSLMTGVLALPATMSVAPVAVLIGIYISKTGIYKWPVWLGWALTTAGFGSFYVLDRNSAFVEVILLVLLLGVGLGTLLPSLGMMVQASISKKDAGHAVAFYYVIRSAGQCAGVVIGTAILGAQLGPRLDVEVAQGAVTADGVMALLGTYKVGSAQATAVSEAIAGAIKVVWVTSCAISGVVGLVCAAMRCPRLPEDAKNEASE